MHTHILRDTLMIACKMFIHCSIYFQIRDRTNVGFAIITPVRTAN